MMQDPTYAYLLFILAGAGFPEADRSQVHPSKRYCGESLGSALYLSDLEELQRLLTDLLRRKFNKDMHKAVVQEKQRP